MSVSEPFESAAQRVAQPFRDVAGWVHDINRARSQRDKAAGGERDPARSATPQLTQQNADASNAARAAQLHEGVDQLRPRRLPLRRRRRASAVRSGSTTRASRSPPASADGVHKNDAVVAGPGLARRAHRAGRRARERGHPDQRSRARRSRRACRPRTPRDRSSRRPAIATCCLLDYVSKARRVKTGDVVTTSGWSDSAHGPALDLSARAHDRQRDELGGDRHRSLSRDPGDARGRPPELLDRHGARAPVPAGTRRVRILGQRSRVARRARSRSASRCSSPPRCRPTRRSSAARPTSSASWSSRSRCCAAPSSARSPASAPASRSTRSPGSRSVSPRSSTASSATPPGASASALSDHAPLSPLIVVAIASLARARRARRARLPARLGARRCRSASRSARCPSAALDVLLAIPLYALLRRGLRGPPPSACAAPAHVRAPPRQRDRRCSCRPRLSPASSVRRRRSWRCAWRCSAPSACSSSRCWSSGCGRCRCSRPTPTAHARRPSRSSRCRSPPRAATSSTSAARRSSRTARASSCSSIRRSCRARWRAIASSCGSPRCSRDDPRAVWEDVDRQIRLDPLAPVTVARDVDRSVVLYLGEHAAHYPGVTVVEGEKRTYPYGRLASHVFGQLSEITATRAQACRATRATSPAG